MCTSTNSNPKPNSFKTNITAPSGVILAEWFSLNPRTDAERRDVAADLGAVIGICAQCQWAEGGRGEHCGNCSCCS